MSASATGPATDRPDGRFSDPTQEICETLSMFASLIEVTHPVCRSAPVAFANETGIDPATLRAILDADIDRIPIGAAYRLARRLGVRFDLPMG